MGVPRFFSWITRRYPLILEDLEKYPLPDIDCLYLDMNGIIYKCSKDESIIFKAQVMSREIEEIWFNIFNYVNAIVDSISPKKLLFLGLDGVAPRAKMNNQRSRRFRSAQDYKELERKLQQYGDTKNEEEFKNNCITPGTEFMNELNRQLRFFIAKKIEEDPKWQKFNVIFSGADVPGEGEHKIMDFIRQSHQLGVYDDTITHCLYGADADLIMLAMSLKVKKMCIIRQEFTMKSKKVIISKARNIKTAKFQIIYVNILKEYFNLEYERMKDSMKVAYDCQRILNDFVFLCFFIGNDFLPRCYCYDIRQGNLEVLIAGFKKFLRVCEDYIIHDDHINLKELERLTEILSEFEKDFIGDRSDEAKKAYKGKNGEPGEATDFDKELVESIEANISRLRTEEEFLLKLKTLYKNDSNEARSLFYEVKLKFKPAEAPDRLNQVLDAYVQGLHYVYQYYFGGLPSWEWYYPYYYAPLVGDLHQYIKFLNSSGATVRPFNKSQPYEPFKQLMCILPRESAQLLPLCLQPLIVDEKSPLRTPVNYFPDNVEIDPYGGLQEHEFIHILPFIDQDKITEVYTSVPQEAFTQEETLRNRFHENELYQADPNGNTFVKSFYSQIADFTAKMTITLVNFKTEDVLKLKKTAPEEIDREAKLQFPSLTVRSFHSEICRPNMRDIGIQITLKEVDTTKNYRLGQEVYFGYPYETHGRVMAIASEKDFRQLKEFRVLDFFRDQDYLESDFQEPRDYWREGKASCVQRGLHLEGHKVYYLCQSDLNYRKLTGDYARSYDLPDSLFLTIDAALVSDTPKYAFTEKLFKPKDLREEFRVGEEVVVLKDKQYAGSRGVVTGYDDNYNEIEVRITDVRPTIPADILQLINTNDYFFSVKFVANMLRLDLQIILDMLDSVQVFIDTDQMSARGMPKTLDIGLNFIKRNEKKLVPSLARLPNQGLRVDNLYKLYCDLEISLAAVNLLCDYKKNYPEIFTFMTTRMGNLIADSKSTGRQINWKSDISAKMVYPSAKDPNEPIIRLYIWLLKKEQIHMPNAAINSKAVSKSKLAQVVNHFRNMKKERPPAKPLCFDPNFLYSQRLSQKGVVHLSKCPPSHAIADRVVCMHEAYFAQRGVVVGIDNDQYEVLFERPSFGKNDLGGKVDYLWGGKFDFSDLFNICEWQGLIEPRFVNGQKNDLRLRHCWNGEKPQFVARFRSQAIRSMKDYHLLGKSVENLPQSGIEQYMSKHDQEEFQVVVDKRNKHRQFYPKEDEKELIDEVIKPGIDIKTIINEFALKKEQSLKETLVQQQLVEQAEQPHASVPPSESSAQVLVEKKPSEQKEADIPMEKQAKQQQKGQAQSIGIIDKPTKVLARNREEPAKISKAGESQPQKQFMRFVPKDEPSGGDNAQKATKTAKQSALPSQGKKHPNIQHVSERPPAAKPKYVEKLETQAVSPASDLLKPAAQLAVESVPKLAIQETAIEQTSNIGSVGTGTVHKEPEEKTSQSMRPTETEPKQPEVRIQQSPATKVGEPVAQEAEPEAEVDDEIFG